MRALSEQLRAGSNAHFANVAEDAHPLSPGQRGEHREGLRFAGADGQQTKFEDRDGREHEPDAQDLDGSEAVAEDGEAE